jgi:hypothetical protein
MALDKEYHGLQAKHYTARVGGSELGNPFVMYMTMQMKCSRRAVYLYTSGGVTETMKSFIGLVKNVVHTQLTLPDGYALPDGHDGSRLPEPPVAQADAPTTAIPTARPHQEQAVACIASSESKLQLVAIRYW